MQDLNQCADNDLISLTLNGNKRAFEMLVIRYQKLVFNVIYQIVKQKETAADLTQETFLKAYRALQTFKQNLPVRPWLLKIATNCALNSLRDNRADQSLEQLMEASPAQEPVAAIDIEREVENSLTKLKLEEVIGSLPPQYRNLFLLRYQHDLSYEEIAVTLDQPVTTIKSLLFRVRAKVRKLMSRELSKILN